MLSQQRQSGPQPGEPLADGLSTNFHLIDDSDDPALALPQILTPAPVGSQSWRLLVISLLGCFVASGAAVGAFLWLINLPPTANCETTATVTTDRAQLFCAQTAAESGELSDVLAALALVGSWTADHPLYYEVQPLVEQWSWVALKAAEQELRSNGSMAEAQALVGYIPADSAVFATAQNTIATWQSEWEQGEALLAIAQEALKQKDWPTATLQVQALAELNNSHWRVNQVQALSRQIRQERQAQELLDRAVATAAPGGSDRLAAALDTASQIDEGTYARQHAQPYLNRWSDLLLDLGLDKWYSSELDAALALGRSAALNPSRAKVAQDLIWLSQSRQLAQQSLTAWRTSPDQMVKLYQAMLLANRVSTDSPYYAQAQSSVATWRGHLGDLARLQTAQAIGQVRHRDAFNAAIDQAAQVPLGHPRRVQAQTMVAHWRQEIERIEDRPQLIQAHTLASAKTVEGLQAAIQTANGVALHRALRNEAQSWIYIWTSELQVMEDQPQLNRARSLAAQGNLSQAIVQASSIRPGRALYGEAQAAIAGWQRQIAAAEQARLRALQRAAAPSIDPAPAPLELEVDASSNDPSMPPEEALPIAPAPAMPDQRLRRAPLPARIETIPGDPAPAAIEAVPPSPPSSQPAAYPTPDTVPTEVVPFQAPPAPLPAPAAAPSPLLIVPPVVAPQPLEMAPDSGASPLREPQAAQPVVPRVSVQPQPEDSIGGSLRTIGSLP
ncbi:hypothetical protein [Nodosilinea sp. E11]|uniref:hypothetical protein n=1 Tax=Nodosilinea sp. E11 TaxID=3037479 RepID=UPI002934755D|nr:hypothetical protein [Nodosilinea sp. E11]WOD39316.1 hypothetical protein RRF56_24210 [Nodosilinea sp. E11]